MTTEVDGPLTLPAPAGRGRLSAYLRLAKLDILDYYLALPLAWALAAPWGRGAPRAALTLGLFLLGEVLVIAAAVALDDVTGFRDGSDAVNYGADAPRRRLARKPLIAGALTERQAVRFGCLAGGSGALLWAAAAAVAPFRPVWALAGAALCVLSAVQYSWGLRISYRGWQEVFLFGFGAGMVLVPYGMLTGRITAPAVLQALLFGYGPMLFGLYSNTNDAEGDAGVGRRTVAALLSRRANARFVAGVTAGEAVLVAAAPVAARAQWWLPLVLLPVLVLRAAELTVFLRREDVLGARRLAIRDHRLTVLLLVVADLLAPAI